jgi:hypothetical protein
MSAVVPVETFADIIAHLAKKPGARSICKVAPTPAMLPDENARDDDADHMQQTTTRLSADAAPILTPVNE